MLSYIIPCESNRSELLMNTLEAYSTQIHFDICEFLVISRTMSHLPNGFGANVRLVNYTYPGTWANPSMALNIGVREAQHDQIVITSPEVMPITPVIHQFCMADQNIAVVAKVSEGTQVLTSSQFRNVHPGFYFLAKYPRAGIEAINGWDEDFMAGLGYDDNDFGERWVRAELRWMIDDRIIGEHLHHSREDRKGVPHNDSLLNRNRTLHWRCKNGLVKE